jgi:hypothetical protein
MCKKINIVSVSLFSIIFLIAFIVNYKNSGKVGESIRIAIIWTTVTLSPRVKADALKNVRKTGGGSIFLQGFTPKRQYCSRPINKPLSCRNNVKINEEQFNGNKNTAKQTNQDCTLTREQRRNLIHPDDVIIPDQDAKIRHGQAKYKVKNHGSDFSLPSKPNEKGWLKTPRTSENIEGFKDEIKKLVLTGERIEGTY